MQSDLPESNRLVFLFPFTAELVGEISGRDSTRETLIKLADADVLLWTACAWDALPKKVRTRILECWPGATADNPVKERCLVASFSIREHASADGEIWFAVAVPCALPATVYVCECCSSTFDLAWMMHHHGLLGEWDGVICLTQTSGRGQLRRPWYSPEGNLHISFRLPGGAIAGSAASVLCASLFTAAFENLGLPLKFKWPNDLVLPYGENSANNASKQACGKLGGILLEEREGVLVAGMGINCARLPDASHLREDAALPPVSLPEFFSPRKPVELWLALVQETILIYKNMFSHHTAPMLLSRAEARLLWLGEEVHVNQKEGIESQHGGNVSDAAALTGRITGLAPDGALCLLVSDITGNRRVEIRSGSISLASTA